MRILFLLIFFGLSLNAIQCKQILPEHIPQITIGAEKSGEKGKNFFVCNNNKKCSTEDVVKEYYKTNGYNIIRGEVTVWQALSTLAFFDEIFYNHNFNYQGDLPKGFFEDDYLFKIRKNMYQKKYEYLKQADIFEFINSQINKYATFQTRLFYDSEVENYTDAITYFYSDNVQEFLKQIDSKIFAKITFKIVQNPNQNRAGIPDYVVWDDKNLIFVEVKREKEILRKKQIKWAEFLLNHNIPYQIVRVR